MRYWIGLLCLLSSGINAAELWLDKAWKPVSKTQASYYMEIAEQANADGMWPVKVFYKQGMVPRFEGLLDKPMQPDQAKATGPYKYFHPNGALLSDGSRDQNGNFTGVTRFFDEQGRLTDIQHFADDKQVGEQTSFWPDGSKKLVYQLQEGKKQGELLQYYQGGQLQLREVYRDGKLNGEQRSYHDNGKLAQTAFYQAGKREGELTIYNAEGGKSEVRVFRHNQRHGLSQRWDKNGQLIAKVSYAEGKRDGDSIEWGSDGSLYRHYRYVAGKQVGEQHLYYHSSEQLMREQHYDDAGQLLVEIRYEKNGNKQRETHYDYSEKQPKTEMIVYKNGLLFFKRQRDPNQQWQLEQEFDQQGNVTESLPYRNQRLDGDFIKTVSSWSGQNLRRITGHYQQGKLNGEYQEVDISSGLSAAKGTYRQDEKVGEWHYRDDNSQRVEHYDQQGRKNGKLLETTLDGKLLRLEHYKQDQLVGEFEQRDSEGLLLGKGDYVGGKRDGDWQYRDDFDKDRFWQGRYRLGNKVGDWRANSRHGYLLGAEQYDQQGRAQGKFYTFAEDGLLTELHHYRNGQQHGEQIYYANGNVYRTEIYRDGEYIESKSDDTALCFMACDDSDNDN
ncbi:hypothetical protein HR45_15105 [Shewanella mangrovi]|uniref:Membrane-binding protein n=1 Tax=Shewanella mangrovi TaxID=1515746 RepID=A0A094J9M4_9GAMM|nr:toxin-antitoxin system YwqK family antitoxin [Shewanella mangrovi]KFZ36625.1 hypothetical protein HR45_15105 [Shewanella mangrovi]